MSSRNSRDGKASVIGGDDPSPAVLWRHDAWLQAPKATVQALLINMTPPITEAFPCPWVIAVLVLCAKRGFFSTFVLVFLPAGQYVALASPRRSEQIL